MCRILIFSLGYLPHIGGAEIAVKETTDRLDPCEFEFHLVTLRMDASLPRQEHIGNVHVYRIGRSASRLSKFLFQFTAASAGAHLHRLHRFDAVWAMMAHSAGVPAALFKHFHPDVPYILTLQEGDPPEHIERTMRPLWPLFTRAFTRADVVQAISTFLGDWARRRGFTGPLEIIPNGVSGKVFSAPILHEQRSVFRLRHGFRENDTVLITASRLVHKNGVDLVIRALHGLPPNVKFLIAGSGPELAALELVAQELGVAERVVFVQHVAHADLPMYLGSSDIFIRASRSEGMGSAFIEAMAAGIPVVAPQVGGIADFLFDTERNPGREPTGFAIDPESPESIVRVIQRIIDDPLRAHQIAVNAQRTVLHEYDWDKIAQEMKEKVFVRMLE